MEPKDFECLSEILSDQAYSAQGKEFFQNLISRANIPKKWKKEIYDIWTGNLDEDANCLIQWAIDVKGDINPEDDRFKTLGGLLYSLLPELGIDQARLIVILIIRYNLFLNQSILINFLIEHDNYQAIFQEDEDGISIITEYIIFYTNQDINKIAEIWITELIKILMTIENFELATRAFLEIFEAFDILIPVSDYSSQEIALMKKNDIGIIFKIFILFYLLLEKLPNTSNYIQKIVDYSALLQKSSTAIRDRLETWLIKVKDNYGYSPSNLFDSDSSAVNSKSDKKEILEASLMIFIRKSPWKEDRAKWIVNGYLIINNFLEKKFDVDLEQEKLLGKNIGQLESIEEIILGWVDDTEDLVRSKKQYIKCDNSSITIEFFLPLLTHGHLSEEADQLKINPSKTIGQVYKVIVRSYERIAYDIGEKVRWGSRYFRYLETKWQALQDILKNNPSCQDFSHKFECNLPNFSDLENNLNNTKIGLKLTCALPNSKKEKDTIFNIILETGVPIAIWLRENQEPGMNLEQRTDKWLKREYLENLNLLLDDIKAERENSRFENSFLGQHLVIFCDNPQKRPIQTRPLKTSNPLSVPQ